MRRTTLAFVCLLVPVALHAQAPQGYYRTPAIHGETVVFSAEGDLWRVPVAGGTAQRMTTHAEEELYPAISPDGRTLAFSASYEGPVEVYTMPLAGGVPTRRTYEGGRATVVGWTPDGDLLYSTYKYSTLPNVQLVRLDLESGHRQLIPLAQAADGSYDGPGGTLYFTRLPEQGSRTKRYKGGTAQKIWKLEPGAPEAVSLTPDYPGTSRRPMWWEGRVYFLSDRDGTMNIWSMGPDGSDFRQHTFHAGWDVKGPALQDGRIVYQLGADLWLYDIAGDAADQVPVALTSDFDQQRERWITDPQEYLTAAHLSPDGDRVVLTARGEVFVAPVEAGRFVHATRDPGARYRSARFLPDGETLIALSDASGEVEWWRLPASGMATPEQLTDDGKVFRFDGVPSPDGRWIAHWDQDQELWLYDMQRGESRRIAFARYRSAPGPAWSPDSRWLAFEDPAANMFERLVLYNVERGTRTAVTSDRYDSYEAAWSPDGGWLFFLSDRHFESLVGSPWGARQPEPFFDKQTQILAIALSKDARFPFKARDELDPESGDASAAGRSQDAAERSTDSAAEVAVDLEGIAERLYQVPVPPGDYDELSTNGERLFWLSAEVGERSATLMALEVKPDDPKPLKLAEGVRDYELSADGAKLLVRKGDDLYVIPASSGSPAKLEEGKLNLSDWKFAVDPREEWRQMFVDSWRLERDYFYDPNMHGVDWRGMLEKYLPLVDRVTTRGELSDLQAQMVSELSALHIFVYGGDHRDGRTEVSPAALGAVLTRDVEAGGYRVDHIYRADPDQPGELSPLARPGVEVGVGDVITAINGVSLLEVPDPGVPLRDQAGEQVRLTVRDGTSGRARDVIVTAISQREEQDLRYDEWEYTRRLRVDSLSGGEIGYLHLRAMGGRNMAEWQRGFYPVFNRKGLIIDVRHNRGGNIDSWVLEKLLRRAWFYWQPRVGEPYWNMQYAFRGHMVMLVDERTASDGEAVAEGFRRLGLGELIGMRTWGGEIWLTSSNRLVDRGIATAAEFGVYGPEGEWLIEGHGVEPDIVVDNLPHATFNGEDAQLRAAVEHLQELIRRDPRPVPAHPPYPDKSFDYRTTTRSEQREGGG